MLPASDSLPAASMRGCSETAGRDATAAALSLPRVRPRSPEEYTELESIIPKLDHWVVEDHHDGDADQQEKGTPIHLFALG